MSATLQATQCEALLIDVINKLEDADRSRLKSLSGVSGTMVRSQSRLICYNYRLVYTTKFNRKLPSKFYASSYYHSIYLLSYFFSKSHSSSHLDCIWIPPFRILPLLITHSSSVFTYLTFLCVLLFCLYISYISLFIHQLFNFVPSGCSCQTFSRWAKQRFISPTVY